MNNYIIITDSSCDLPQEYYTEWGIPKVCLTFRFENEDTEFNDGSMDSKLFYSKMRSGSVAKTSAVNSETFTEIFDKYLKNGTDIFYFGLSSGISATYNSARIAAEQLCEKYPDRRIVVFDSMTASTGSGLFLYHLVQKRDRGADLDALVAYAEELRPKLCHFFTVDDLVYLKRGGRISAASAFFGNALGIKPVLHVDDEGHLTPIEKVRGRKVSLKNIADRYTELAEDPENGTVFICHGDCIDDANYVCDLLRERHGVEVKIISYTGTVVGAHSGPGTFALFFVGKHR